jgi:hypothetical protein
MFHFSRQVIRSSRRAMMAAYQRQSPLLALPAEKGGALRDHRTNGE